MLVLPHLSPLSVISENLERTAAAKESTRQRVARSRALCAEGAEHAQRTVEIIRASLGVLRSLSTPVGDP